MNEKVLGYVAIGGVGAFMLYVLSKSNQYMDSQVRLANAYAKALDEGRVAPPPMVVGANGMMSPYMPMGSPMMRNNPSTHKRKSRKKKK